MKKTLIAFVFLILPGAFAYAGTKFCQNGGGSGELSINGQIIEIRTQGLGEADGVLSFVKMQKIELNAEWIANYSELLQVPIFKGFVFDGKINMGKQSSPAKIFLLETAKDLQGRIQHVLMLSLAGSPPSLIGVDVNCK